MENKNRTCTIKRAIRWFDFFGESFTFRYKDEDKHSTLLGGIICIIFFTIFISYFIYNFIPFIKRENFTLQYYTMNLNNTEHMLLAEPPTAFAFGLMDDNNDTNNNISDLFVLNIKYVECPKGKQKNKSPINKNYCNKTNFHNLHQKLYDNLKIDNFNCIPKNNLEINDIKGIFTDDLFTYYEISVESKYKDNETHNKLINDYLIKYDCKLQFYYTDVTINLTNLKNPISSFFNTIFLQLNPTLIQKKNIFFMNYHLYDDNSFFHIFGKEEERIYKTTGLSKEENYALYKGLDRAENKPDDYEIYAKMFIRADNRKIVIKRRYPDFMEFYADTSALLLSIFWILGIIFAYYDRIKANHSISQKLFYFEGIKYNNYFETFKKLKKMINFNDTEAILDKRVFFKEKIDTNKYKDEKIDTNTKFKIKAKNINNKELINYSSYNIFEMIGNFILCCCKTKKFKSKINLIKKANNIIDDKLDIVFYIRNMILFEIINKIYLENENIINFLSRPIIYLNDENENKIQEIEKSKNYINISSSGNEIEIITSKKDINEVEKLQYHPKELYISAYKLNINLLSKNIEDISLNPNKTKVEENIIHYLKEHFKGIN